MVALSKPQRRSQGVLGHLIDHPGLQGALRVNLFGCHEHVQSWRLSG